ncbi:Uncharacterised protein [Collinsella intestinalis]|nr:Uncharacterised protein [Collinsella intestinalis]
MIAGSESLAPCTSGATVNVHTTSIAVSTAPIASNAGTSLSASFSRILLPSMYMAGIGRLRHEPAIFVITY